MSSESTTANPNPAKIQTKKLKMQNLDHLGAMNARVRYLSYYEKKITKNKKNVVEEKKVTWEWSWVEEKRSSACEGRPSGERF